MAIEYRMYGYLDFQDAVEVGALNLNSVVAMYNNPNKICLVYDTSAATPNLSVDTAANADGESVIVATWPQGMLQVAKSGSGSCSVAVQARYEDGTWWTLPDSVGTSTFSLSAGAQTLLKYYNLAGWYEARVVVSGVSGTISVQGYLAKA